MEIFGHLPAHVAEDVLLALGVVEVVLPADDVGHPHQMVVNSDGEVHHRVRLVLGTGAGVGGVHQPEGDEVPDGRVGVGDVRLHDGDGLAGSVSAAEEFIVTLHLLVDRQVPAGAGLLLLLLRPPVLGVAGADIGVALLDEPAGDIVVELEPLALDELLVDLHTEPVQVLGDHVVGVRVDLLGVGVLETEDEFALVALGVLVVEHGYSGVSDVERTGGTGGDPHNGLPLLHVLKVGELVGADLLLLLGEGGVDGIEFRLLGLGGHGVDVPYDLVDELGGTGDVGTAFGVGAEDLPDYGLGVGLSLELDGVLQCEFPYLVLDGGHNVPTNRGCAYKCWHGPSPYGEVPATCAYTAVQ